MKTITQIITILLVLVSLNSYAQIDNEFWFVVPEVTVQHSSSRGEPTRLRVSSLGDTVLVIIDMPALGLVLDSTILPAGEYYSYDLTQHIRLNYDPNNPATGVSNPDPNAGDPNPDNIIESGLYGYEGMVESKGIRIRSKGININNRNDKISVYCDRFNFNNKDIWALKGKNALGTEFTIPGQNVFSNKSYSSEPQALNAFDIVATENNTVVSITPKARLRNNFSVPFYYEKDVTFQILLNKGETFSCVAETYYVAAHLGGSVVSSDKPIAITLKDDSLRPDSGYDLAGDQLVPDNLGGYEFIVMRGELSSDVSNNRKSPEYAFVTSLSEGTTTVNYSGGGVLTLNGRGDIQPILMNAKDWNEGNIGEHPTETNIDALYIQSDQRVTVWHITGFLDEVGGALIPPIDVCTGSREITVVRSSAVERYFLNLMAQSDDIGNFQLQIDQNGDGTYDPFSEVFPMNPTWFAQVENTDWYYLTKDFNEFTDNVTSPVGVGVEANSPLKITNTGRFHLGTIEGGNSGCKVGYFSNFATDSISALLGIQDSVSSQRYCYGDTIQLFAHGGVSHQWFFNGEQSYHEFITDSNIYNPLAIIEPENSIQGSYYVRIERECPLDGRLYDTLAVDVTVYKETIADFTVDTAGNCGEVSVQLQNNPQSFTDYYWEIETHDDTIKYAGLNPDPYDLLNTATETQFYNVELVAVKTNLCYDTLLTTIGVNPPVNVQIESTDLSVSNGNSLEFQALVNDPALPVSWTFNNGYTSTQSAFSYTFVNETDTLQTIQVILEAHNDVTSCSDADTVYINVYPDFTLGLGLDKTICQGDSVLLEAPDFYESYLWSSGQTEHAIWVNEQGLYTVTVTNQFNETTTESVAVFVNDVPQIDLPENIQVCNGETVNYTAQSGFATYNWNDSIFTETIALQNAGIYTLQVSNEFGCVVSDSLLVIVNELPVFELPNDTVVCGNQTFTFSGPSGMNAYSWSSGETEQDIAVNETGIYALEVEGGNGCKYSDTVIVTINAYPEFNLPDTMASCSGDTIELAIDPVFDSYVWSTGETLNQIEVISDGRYKVEVTQNGCTIKDSVTVYFHELPQVNLGIDQSICDGDNITLDAGAGFVSYLWSTGETSQEISVPITGSYSVIVTDQLSCSNADSINIFVNASPSIALADSIIGCAGDTLHIASQSNLPVDFLWSTGENTSSIEVVEEGTYYLEVISNDGCMAVDSITVLLQELPEVDLGSDIQACIGEIVSLDAGDNGMEYTWNTGINAQILEVSESGIYSVSITNENGCSNSDFVQVEFNELPEVDLPNDYEGCFGDSINLNVSIENGTYLWSNGITAPEITIYTTGEFVVTVTNSFNCSNFDTILVTLHDLPEMGFEPVIESCIGDQIVLDASSGFESYLWSTGETTQVITVENSGSYTITIADENCENSDTIDVIFYDIPEINLADTVNSCQGDTVVLSVDMYDNILWSTGESSSHIEVTNSGLYLVEVTNEFGCYSSDTTAVIFNPKPDFYLPVDTTACDGNIIWLTVPEGFTHYQWSTGANINSVAVADSGLYELQVTNAYNCMQSKQTQVNFIYQPISLFTYTQNQNEITFQNESSYADLYKWSFGNGMTSYAENPVVTYTHDNSYMVTLRAENSCGTNYYYDTIQINSNSNSELVNQNIELHPNPVKNELNVILSEIAVNEKIEIVIFNAIGRIAITKSINNQKHNVIDVSDLSEGVYYLKLIIDNKIHTHKFIVE